MKNEKNPQVLHHHNKSPAHYQVQVRIWLFGWCEQFLSKCLQPRWWEMTKWRFFQSPRSLIEDTGRRCCSNLNWSTCHLSCIISLVLCAKSGLASSKKMPHIPCHSPPVTMIRSTSHTFDLNPGSRACAPRGRRRSRRRRRSRTPTETSFPFPNAFLHMIGSKSKLRGTGKASTTEYTWPVNLNSHIWPGFEK